MSISSSLANALSGLTATARSAQVVSSNVANAASEGYGKREISLNSATAYGGGTGVRVTSINRTVNDAAIADRRLSDASFGENSQKTAFYADLEAKIGLPGDQNSLGSKISTFESSLIAASSNPDSEARLNSILFAAKDLADHLNGVADTIQDQRAAADGDIAFQVQQINAALQDVDSLNKEISRQIVSGGEPLGLMDQRQIQIDRISEYIPLQEVPRDLGQVALMTPTGATLVDNKAAVLGFSPTPVITADMTLASGALSGLSITGAATSLGDAYNAIAGGSLAAAFEVRDTIAVDAQVQTDALARNLIERFSEATLDPTTAAGAPGFFTDNGAAFLAADEEGLSSRIRVNEAVDPDNGGLVSRIRDGLGAATVGPVGENGLITALRDALEDTTVPISGAFSSANSFSGTSSEFLSQIGTSRQVSEFRQTFASTQVTALKDAELNAGVNTDDELQKLLLIEQAYAANARIIQAVDEMIQSILRI